MTEDVFTKNHINLEGKQDKLKKHIAVFVALLALMILPQVQGLQNSSQTIGATGTINYVREMSIGVNYLSTYNTYSSRLLPDDMILRDFARFKADGINVISLCLYWCRLEGNIRGSYDGINPGDTYPYGDGFLKEIKRVIGIANENGIKVLVDIHTLWSLSDSSWCTPKYVIDPVTGGNDGLAIVRSDDMRQAFIDMFNHTVRYLSGTPGIWAWAILNEPWFWGRTPNESDFITSNGKTQKENFITLIQQLSNIVKTVDGRPVTIRFCSTYAYTATTGALQIRNIFTDWGWDQRIFDALDFISFNSYIPEYPQLEDAWRNMTAANVIACSEKNKQVWITEFGSNSDNETQQAEAYDKMLRFYASLPISGCLAWHWATGNVPDEVTESKFNICADIQTGRGKPAYDELHLFKTG